MYLLKFDHNNKSYFLHDGESFIGSTDKEQMNVLGILHMAKQISIGGFTVVEADAETLTRMVGGIPYKIISFFGGLVPFMGVEIVND